MAKLKAEEIRTQASITSDQLSNTLMAAIENDIERLIQTDLLTIRLEEEKYLINLFQRLVQSAISDSKEKLKKKLTSAIQKKKMVQKLTKLYKKKFFVKK